MANWRPSLPLLWLSLAFLAGLVLGAWAGIPWPVWAGLTALALGAVFLERRLTPRWGWLGGWRRLSPLPLSLLFAGLLAGALRWQAAQPVFSQQDLAFYNGRQAQLTGWVSGTPLNAENFTSLPVTVESVRLADEGQTLPIYGRVEVLLPAGWYFNYGGRLELNGTLEAAQQGQPVYDSEQTYSLMRYPTLRRLDGLQGSAFLRWLYAWRADLQRVIQRSLPLPESALLEGVVLGIDQNLPEETKQSFRNTGVAHIIAVSGFNVAVVAGLFVMLFSRGRFSRLGQAAALAGVILYTLLTGAQPPAVRAAILAGLGILAAWVGRSQTTANSLGLAAAGMAALDPGLPWNASFQLSFTATLGLALLAGPWQQKINAWLEARQAPGWASAAARIVGEPLLVTASAQIATLPVMLYLSHNFSLTSLLANLLILPPQPLILILGGLSALAGWVWYPLGQALGALTWPLLAYTIRAAELLGSVAPLWLGPFPGWLALVSYLLAAAAYLLRGRLFGTLRRTGATAALAGTLLLAGLTWRTALLRPDGSAHLWILGGQETPVLLLQTPQGRSYVFNAPDTSLRLQDLLGRQLPPLDARLDGLLLAANRAAALRAAADTLRRTPAGQVYLPPLDLSSRAADTLLRRLRSQNLAPAVLSGGQTLELEPGVQVSLSACTDSACALELDVEGLRLWLPGGASSPADGQAAVALLSASDQANNPGLLAQLNPSLLLWAGPPPTPELLNGAQVVGLNDVDWVELTIDSGQVWVEVKK